MAHRANAGEAPDRDAHADSVWRPCCAPDNAPEQGDTTLAVCVVLAGYPRGYAVAFRHWSAEALTCGNQCPTGVNTVVVIPHCGLQAVVADSTTPPRLEGPVRSSNAVMSQRNPRVCSDANQSHALGFSYLSLLFGTQKLSLDHHSALYPRSK